ncbi:two-component sensor histidine kinase [Pandoraea captiosa]|uniref:histidine kinase n=1 Tax=Pandoraea captiosa TaxID=2508302 RepID=A0A5E5AIE3_9BURK|nr:ATP-binding protein [Pandoraea captiosa]VVE73284.1 two-component sensor histidine kinase [Pandoraea captiosa]
MSLRLRAVLIAGVALVLLWSAAAGWMMRGVRASLDDALDERLAMSATMVSGLMARAAFSPLPQQRDWDEVIRTGASDGIACEIRSLQGAVLAHTDGGPQASSLALPAGFSTHEIDGRRWRIYVLQDAGGYQVMTADLVGRRAVLARDMLRAAGVPFFIAVVGGLLALWIGIGQGLMPLETLRTRLRHKRTDDTTPVDIGRAPTELRPVVAALNAWLDRLAYTLAGQRAFTDGAAHELRTPLTAIDTHLQVAQMTHGEPSQRALQQASAGVKRMRHTLDQMMTLAHAEAPVHAQDKCDSIGSVIDDVLSEWGEADRFQFRMTGADSGSVLPRSMLVTAVRNLVDNAVRYSPANSEITVTVRADDAPRRYCIEVGDRGPGLAPGQTERLGQRFWRGDLGRERVPGAGLGISIVQAIARRFDATLAFAPRDGGGLLARLTIPAGE